MGLSVAQFRDILGLDKYIERYGHQPGFPDMRQHMAEFDDWQLLVPFGNRHITLLCCPEDRCCKSKQSERCLSGKTLCEECELPVCKYCEAALTHAHGARMPESALANDLMVFYAPSI